MIAVGETGWSELFKRMRRGRPKNAFSEVAAELRAKQIAALGESEPESEPAQRAEQSSAPELSSDLVAAILLAGARRRGEAPLAPPPPTPVAMTAEGIINAGRRRRGEAA